MLDFLDHTDRTLFLFLNDLHSPFWDQVMWWISERFIWLPLYLLITGYLIYRYKWKIIVILILVALLITMSDQGSVHLFKEVFKRLRPCHNPEISHLVHIVRGHCGGQYGFVSSHAANSFAVASYSLLLIRNRYYTVFIIFWALLVSYSRIYLGVHYPGDILGGAILGIVLGYVVYRLFVYIDRIVKRKGDKGVSEKFN
jgi:undecaprenyl-diphosphatase